MVEEVRYGHHGKLRPWTLWKCPWFLSVAYVWMHVLDNAIMVVNSWQHELFFGSFLGSVPCRRCNSWNSQFFRLKLYFVSEMIFSQFDARFSQAKLTIWCSFSVSVSESFSSFSRPNAADVSIWLCRCRNLSLFRCTAMCFEHKESAGWSVGSSMSNTPMLKSFENKPGSLLLKLFCLWARVSVFVVCCKVWLNVAESVGQILIYSLDEGQPFLNASRQTTMCLLWQYVP